MWPFKTKIKVKPIEPEDMITMDIIGKDIIARIVTEINNDVYYYGIIINKDYTIKGIITDVDSTNKCIKIKDEWYQYTWYPYQTGDIYKFTIIN